MAQAPRKYSTSSLKQMPKRSLPRNLPRYALIFLAGLLVGWFVFGWWLFPIEYTQVYPNELHIEARNEYFQMVAEGYALTGDRIRAAQRLQYWNVDDELPRVINARIQALESTNPDEVEPLRRMAEELHLTQTTAIPKTPGQTLGEVGSGIGRTMLILLGGVLLLVLLWVIYRRVFAPQTGAIPQKAPTPERTAPPVPQTDEVEWAIDGDFEAIETLGGAPIREERRPPPVEDDGIETVVPPIYQPLADEDMVEEDDWDDEDEDAAEPITLPPPVLMPSEPAPIDREEEKVEVAPEKKGYLFERVFRFDGRPKFNEIQHIGEADDYFGEVGLGAGEETKDNQVRTLELWLFDKADIQTKAVVLMPLEVYEDEEQRIRLVSGSSDVAPLHPGEKIRLETRTFAVEGEVRRVDFGPVIDGAPSIHYAELLLKCRRLDNNEKGDPA